MSSVVDGIVPWHGQKPSGEVYIPAKEVADLKKRIAELEYELFNAAAAIEQAYGGLPKDRFPGPPTSIVEHMRAVACCKGK